MRRVDFVKQVIAVVSVSAWVLVMGCGSGGSSGSANGGASGTGLVGGSGEGGSSVVQPMGTALSACLPANPLYPGGIFNVLSAVNTALVGKGTPGSTYIGLMPNHQSAFWSTPKLGYTQAQTEIGCLGDFHFPPSKTDPDGAPYISADQQATMIAWTTGTPGTVPYPHVADGTTLNATSSLPKASAIALSSKTPADMIAPINAALAAGIPVVGFDSDCPKSNRPIYVGAENGAAGAAAAKAMVALLGANPTGTLIVLEGPTAGTAGDNQYDRTLGILTTLAATAVGAPITATGSITTTYSSATLPAVSIVTETGIDGSAAHPIPSPAMLVATAATATSKLIGIIAINSTLGPLLADWLTKSGINTSATGPRLQVVAWDTNSPVLPSVQSGLLQATVAQRAYFYGYLVVYIEYAMSVLGIAPTMQILDPFLTNDVNGVKAFLDTGIDLVTTTNLADYSTYQSQCLGVTSH